jgi:protein TonB
MPLGGGAGGMAGSSADYIAILQAWLERHKDYPSRARLRGQEGTVLLYLMIDDEGRVLDQRIERSAGFALLDDAAREMVERAQPLPRAPDGLGPKRLELVVPVRFFLR